MIIIWGTRPYFKTNKVTQYKFCDNCQQYTKIANYHARRFFHLYYIPLIPTTKRQRYHQICTKCELGEQLEDESFVAMQDRMKSWSADAIVAVQNGEEETPSLANPQEMFNCVSLLEYTFESLYAAGDVAFCNNVIQQLHNAGSRYHAAMSKAYLEVLSGNLAVAETIYEQAAYDNPKSYMPHYWRGRILAELGKKPAAIQALTHAVPLAEEVSMKVTILLLRAKQQLELKQYQESVDSYAEALSFNPELHYNAYFQKNYKKAKKKAGVK